MDGEGEGDEVKLMIRKDNTISVRAITLRVPGYLITNVLLIWSILYGIELATQTKTYTGGEWDFHVGVITMVLGFILLFVEIHTLATMYLEFPTGQSQLQDKENGTHQGDMYLELAGKLQQQEEENGNHEGSNLKADISMSFAKINHTNRITISMREMTIGEVIVSILVDVIIVFMLLWIIFTAFGFAGEPTGDSPDNLYHFLIRNLVGIVTTLTGIFYLMYGLAIMLVLAIDLSSRLKQKEKKGSSILEGQNTNITECLV